MRTILTSHKPVKIYYARYKRTQKYIINLYAFKLSQAETLVNDWCNNENVKRSKVCIDRLYGYGSNGLVAVYMVGNNVPALDVAEATCKMNH